MAKFKNRVKHVVSEINDDLQARGLDHALEAIAENAAKYTLGQFIKDICKLLLIPLTLIFFFIIFLIIKTS